MSTTEYIELVGSQVRLYAQRGIIVGARWCEVTGGREIEILWSSEGGGCYWWHLRDLLELGGVIC